MAPKMASWHQKYLSFRDEIAHFYQVMFSTSGYFIFINYKIDFIYS